MQVQLLQADHLQYCNKRVVISCLTEATRTCSGLLPSAVRVCVCARQWFVSCFMHVVKSSVQCDAAEVTSQKSCPMYQLYLCFTCTCAVGVCVSLSFSCVLALLIDRSSHRQQYMMCTWQVLSGQHREARLTQHHRGCSEDNVSLPAKFF